MGMYFNNRYTNRRWMDNNDDYYAESETWGIPNKYYLGNTPLNESLIYLNKLIPMYKEKYGIEKLTFITLTDGAGNYPRGDVVGNEKKDWDKTNVYELGKTKFTNRHGSITSDLLNHIKKSHGANVIGFYIIKRVRRWDIEQYCEGDWLQREKEYNKLRKEMTRDKAIAINKSGYSKYFLLDGKKMNVENFSFDDAEIKKATPSEFKRLFGKSMQSRLVSRVVLNKFIKEVA